MVSTQKNNGCIFFVTVVFLLFNIVSLDFLDFV